MSAEGCGAPLSDANKVGQAGKRWRSCPSTSEHIQGGGACDITRAADIGASLIALLLQDVRDSSDGRLWLSAALDPTSRLDPPPRSDRLRTEIVDGGTHPGRRPGREFLGSGPRVLCQAVCAYIRLRSYSWD